MEKQDKQLEHLNQQASTLYLQGEYVAALEAWRQLLRIDPGNERAREGARLCELLVDEESGSPPSRPTEPTRAAHRRAGAADQAPGYGVGEQLEQELDELDEMLGDGQDGDWEVAQAAPDAPDSPPAPAAEAESGASFDFDLSDPVDSRDPIPGGAGVPVASDFDLDFHGTDRPAAETGSVFDFTSSDTCSDERAPDGDAAARELQRRADELMAEALEHYERGEREEALAVLSRLAILDDGNEAANTFAAHIRAEIEDQQPAPPTPPPADPGVPADVAPARVPPPVPRAPRAESGELNHRPLDLEGNGADGLDLGRPSPTGDPEDRVDDDGVEIDDALIGDELVASEGASDTVRNVAPAAAGDPRVRKALMAAVAAVVLIGAVWVGVKVVGPASADAAAATQASLAAPPPLDPDAPAATGQATPEPPAGAQASNPAPAASLADIDAALDRGDQAYESGNYAAAVLSYNEALKLDPQNEVARRKLAEAGELYAVQKESLEQRTRMVQAFDDGDYRNALSILYRLAPSDEAEARRFERAKFHGWYNMGARALKSGDCRLARSNLDEAMLLAPTDPDLRYALELNEACFEGATDRFFDQVRALPFHGIDD